MLYSMIAPLGKVIEFHDRLIAIVDDDEIFRSYFSILLAQTGARIRTLACSDELLELIEREMPACIILDNKLLSENGIDVFKRLRASYANLAPVIMLSADETQTTAVQAFRNGFDDYLQKRNLRPEDIEQAIQRALAHHEISRSVEPPRAHPAPSPPEVDPIIGAMPGIDGMTFVQIDTAAEEAWLIERLRHAR